jgi:hypothetical protein
VRYALEGPGGALGPWTTITLTNPKKVTISGLTLAGIYHFQIRALGKLLRGFWAFHFACGLAAWCRVWELISFVSYDLAIGIYDRSPFTSSL